MTDNIHPLFDAIIEQLKRDNLATVRAIAQAAQAAEDARQEAEAIVEDEEAAAWVEAQRDLERKPLTGADRNKIYREMRDDDDRANINSAFEAAPWTK